MECHFNDWASSNAIPTICFSFCCANCFPYGDAVSVCACVRAWVCSLSRHCVVLIFALFRSDLFGTQVMPPRSCCELYYLRSHRMHLALWIDLNCTHQYNRSQMECVRELVCVYVGSCVRVYVNLCVYVWAAVSVCVRERLIICLVLIDVIGKIVSLASWTCVGCEGLTLGLAHSNTLVYLYFYSFCILNEHFLLIITLITNVYQLSIETKQQLLIFSLFLYFSLFIDLSLPPSLPYYLSFFPVLPPTPMIIHQLLTPYLHL